MKIFLSYASEDAGKAGEINAALTNEDHKVFFSGYDIHAGEGFDKKIRENIQQCDLFVFLISPDSVRKGKYTLTELHFAEENWEKLTGNVFPVMLRETPRDAIPGSLLRLDIVEGSGNLVAEIAGEVAKIERARFGRRISPVTRSALISSVSGLVIGALLIGFYPTLACSFGLPGCKNMSRVTLNCKRGPAGSQSDYEAEDAYVLVAGDFDSSAVAAQIASIGGADSPQLVSEGEVTNDEVRYAAVIRRLPGSGGGGDKRRWALLRQVVEKPSEIVFPLPKLDEDQSAHFFVDIKNRTGTNDGLIMDKKTGIRELANLVVREDGKDGKRGTFGAFGSAVMEVEIELYEGEISCWRNVPLQ